jgi:hypothetical protein
LSGALIVTAEIGPREFGWLEGLRRAHYPPERNRVPAHLTMFHALPPSSESEVRSTLARLGSEPPPRASIEGLMDLGGGVAFRIVSPDLDRMRGELADSFRGLLGAQDAGGWRPHITIQNKVPPREARALIATLERDFRPQPLSVSGLGLHCYLDGRWKRLATYAFRGR